MTVFGTEPVKDVKIQYKKFQVNKTPIEIFANIYSEFDNCFILESVIGPKKLSEYSFIGFNPETNINIKNSHMKITNINGGKNSYKINDPIKSIQQVLNKRVKDGGTARFTGGGVGYISYNTVRNMEKSLAKSTYESEYPDVEMGIYEDGIIINHTNNEAYYFHVGKNRFKDLTEVIRKKSTVDKLNYSNLKTNMSREKYERAVTKIKEHIVDGDIFQAVLARKIEFNLKGQILGFYKQLREINPSPYMYIVKMGKRAIVGSSPEMLVRVIKKRVETFPIAGTRPIGDNKLLNRKLANELLSDPKDKSEHVMLVDLARNDVGKISVPGTVKVPEFMKVHQYSHVQHIVSQVIGEISNKYNSYDALKAVFPAGTVSGAPKIRAMELIDKFEVSARGPYAGALGYFSFNGNSDFAITIRTLTINNQQATLQVGAGIVAESIPKMEWKETEQKAQVILKTLEKSTE